MIASASVSYLSPTLFITQVESELGIEIQVGSVGLNWRALIVAMTPDATYSGLVKVWCSLPKNRSTTIAP
jgi:hypothetical protein